MSQQMRVKRLPAVAHEAVRSPSSGRVNISNVNLVAWAANYRPRIIYAANIRSMNFSCFRFNFNVLFIVIGSDAGLCEVYERDDRYEKAGVQSARDHRREIWARCFFEFA